MRWGKGRDSPGKESRNRDQSREEAGERVSGKGRSQEEEPWETGSLGLVPHSTNSRGPSHLSQKLQVLGSLELRVLLSPKSRARRRRKRRGGNIARTCKKGQAPSR